MRLGLCCTFHHEAIGFRTTTARALSRLAVPERAVKLRAIAAHNAAALRAAMAYCARHDIGCFRVTSRILPLRTHPRLGYGAELLGPKIVGALRACGRLARQTGTRITFHPDQFVVLSSPDEAVVLGSLAEIEQQAEIAEWIGADVINIHGGGGYGDKPAALQRLAANIRRLSARARSRLTIENDDRTFTPHDLLGVCASLGLPLIYDVHHHRCHPDGLGIEEAVRLAASTWRRRPVFHVSSPRGGWSSAERRRHADFIRLSDFPRLWEDMDCTVEVEAKAKELAVRKLQTALRRRARRRAEKDPADSREGAAYGLF